MYCDDPESFRAKLAEADAIQGYPHYYQRAVVEAMIEEDQVVEGESAFTAAADAEGERERVQCYIYHRPRTLLSLPAWLGDWSFSRLLTPWTPTGILFSTKWGRKLTSKPKGLISLWWPKQ